VDRHFGGRIGPPAERALREHLPECDRCRSYYDRHLLLARLDPRTPAAEARLARGLGLEVRPARHRIVWVASVAAAAAAVVLVVLLWPRATTTPGGFEVRGGAGDGEATSILVYRVRPGLAPALVQDGGTIAAEDELALAYRNAAAKKRLLVFGVDDHQNIYWYHPAWVDAAENPAAVPIEPGTNTRELPEAIAHKLSGSRLTIHAVFCDRSLTVREVEAQLRRDGKLSAEGAIQRTVSLTVERGGTE
jgi:hypothetical protein